MHIYYVKVSRVREASKSRQLEQIQLRVSHFFTVDLIQMFYLPIQKLYRVRWLSIARLCGHYFICWCVSPRKPCLYLKTSLSVLCYLYFLLLRCLFESKHLLYLSELRPTSRRSATCLLPSLLTKSCLPSRQYFRRITIWSAYRLHRLYYFVARSAYWRIRSVHSRFV